MQTTGAGVGKTISDNGSLVIREMAQGRLRIIP